MSKKTAWGRPRESATPAVPLRSQRCQISSAPRCRNVRLRRAADPLLLMLHIRHQMSVPQEVGSCACVRVSVRVCVAPGRQWPPSPQLGGLRRGRASGRGEVAEASVCSDILRVLLQQHSNANNVCERRRVEGQDTRPDCSSATP
jgi:hypothetical protein